jgi:hypothetical protein
MSRIPTVRAVDGATKSTTILSYEGQPDRLSTTYYALRTTPDNSAAPDPVDNHHHPGAARRCALPGRDAGGADL